ncbi:MAG TPA: M56 family metallopeptidase [Candidatus Saccharimonadales bacterium]|nr:M56 family metallopeptidase [Candidatus Saccharimonadales bacterium]
MSGANWIKLMLWVAAETTALVAVAAVLQKWLDSPKAKRTVWQAALTTVALVCVVEISGVRDKIPRVESTRHRYAITALLLSSSATETKAENRAAEEVAPVLEDHHAAMKWPAWIWLGGSALLLTRFGLARIWLMVRYHAAVPADQDSKLLIARLQTTLGLRRVQSQVWSGLRSPVAFGIGRPTIALPLDFSARFSAAEREVVLAHEIAHLAAHDPFWLMLSDAVTALLWWHPLTWWARGQLQSANEAAADEASALIPGGAHALAECLVRLGHELTAPNPARALGIGGSGPRSQLADRVQRLLRNPPAWRPSSTWRRWTPHFSALCVASTFAILPIQTGLSGSMLAIIANPAEPGASGGLPVPNQMARTNKAPLAVQPPAPQRPNPTPPVIQLAEGSKIQPVGRSNSAPTVLLRIQVLVVTEHSADDIGLDWIFGVAPSDNPALEISHDWTALGGSPVSHSENLMVDRLRIYGQTDILKPAQFTALQNRIRGKDVKFASCPTITTRSGLESCVSVEDRKAIVTGVKVVDASPTNSESINYLTDQMDFGFAVDVVPTLKDDGKWRLRVRASDTAFLNYDKLTNDPLAVPDFPRRSVSGETPRPHLRAVEADADEAVPLNQTLALRGPLWTETTKTKAHFIFPARTTTARKRLYIFVTPTHPPPPKAGEPPP